VHPTQLYHAVAGLAGFAILLGMGARPAGARLAAGLAFYGVTRLAIEFLRADAVPVAGPLDVNQLVCLAMIAAGAMLWARRPRPGLREGPA
jgi:phosphatidylglycerol:prolipoprotein diacylglycerol transferase